MRILIVRSPKWEEIFLFGSRQLWIQRFSLGSLELTSSLAKKVKAKSLKSSKMRLSIPDSDLIVKLTLRKRMVVRIKIGVEELKIFTKRRLWSMRICKRSELPMSNTIG